MKRQYIITMFGIGLLALLFVACGPVPVPSAPTASLVVTETRLPPTLTNTVAPSATNTSIPPIMVSITSLSDGADIPRTIDISGQYQNIPQDRQIWLYVYATYIKKYFLLPIDRLNNGTWQVRKVIIGADGENGTKYKIGIISVNLSDDISLQANSSELVELPQSTQNLIELTVYRK